MLRKTFYPLRRQAISLYKNALRGLLSEVSSQRYFEDPLNSDNLLPASNEPITPALGPPVQLAQAIAAFFSLIPYCYGMFDFAILLHALREGGEVEVVDSPALLLISPYRLLRHPGVLPQVLGEQRGSAVERTLLRLWAEHEMSAGSLTQVSVQEGETDKLLITFLRGMCVCSALNHPYQCQAVHVVNMLLDVGYVDDGLTLQGDYNDRGVTLARLFLSAAHEFGSMPMLLSALTLATRLGIAIDFGFAKQMSACLTRIDRRALDWRLKQSASLRISFSRKRAYSVLFDDLHEMSCADIHGPTRALAAALSQLELKYKFTISSHPQKANCLRVVFSRPTFQLPESPVFVVLDAVTRQEDENSFVYDCHLEHLHWPLQLRVTDNIIDKFPELYVDKVWEQKMMVRGMTLWNT